MKTIPLNSSSRRTAIRVLILDLPEAFAEMQKALGETPECELHICSELNQASFRIDELRPDILLIDEEFTRGSALSLIQRAKHQMPEGYILVTMSKPKDREPQYLQAGASKCVLKKEPFPTYIASVIKRVLIEVLEQRLFVVSALSGTMRDFLIAGSQQDLLSRFPAFEKDQEVNQYRIVKSLGEGGMGEVYRAKDATNNRTVAIKALPLPLSKDRRARSRFLREAEVTAKLNHPNIIQFISLEEYDGFLFIVMEYLEGETLSSILARETLPFIAVLNVGAQIADGLSAAHAAGLIHRDIKPSNIMVGSAYQAKLFDFGLAKKIPVSDKSVMGGASTITQLSAPGIALGTASYMSPEQTRDDQLDSRTDIFSLGCVLYEAATGNRPFTGDSALAIIAAISRTEPSPIISIRKDFPKEFDSVIKRAMAKDRKARYQDAGDFAADLRRLK